MIVISAGILALLAGGFLYFQNNSIVINEINYKNSKIPKGFNDYKILQISDLHNKEFGRNQVNLINKTKEINPDIIVITGDLIDSNRSSEKDISIALSYIKEAVKIATVYYVRGNHEIRVPELYKKLKKEMDKLKVVNLDDNCIAIERKSDKIDLIGLQDMKSIKFYYDNKDRELIFKSKLKKIKSECNNNFSILLSHRPELLWAYCENKVDLVFTGHAHGGQIRLPLLGGLYSPSQGVLPKYTSGVKSMDDTSMVISRGLGNSRFPFRIFNRPELVVVNLKSEK